MGRILRAYRAAFAGLPRPVWTLAGAMLVNRSGTMVLPFLALYLTRRMGFTAEAAGLILAAYGLGSVAGSYLGGRLSDRFGAIRVQVGSLIGAGAGYLVLGHVSGRAALTFAAFVAAVLSDAFRPAALTAAAELSPQPVRTRSLALLRLAVNLGMSIGPAVGGILAERHYSWLFVVDAGTSWAAALLLWLALGRHEAGLRADSVAAVGVGEESRSPWRDRPFLLMLGLWVVLATVFFQVMGTLPLYLRSHYGLSESRIGAMFALNALTIVAFEMLLMRAVERFAPLRLIAVGAFFVCFGMAVLPLGSGVGLAVASTMLWTVGEMLAMPLSNAVAAHRAGTGRRGAYIGAYTLSFSIAFVTAPLLGTRVYERLGPPWLWGGIGALGVALALGFWSLSGAMKDPQPDEAAD